MPSTYLLAISSVNSKFVSVGINGRTIQSCKTANTYLQIVDSVLQYNYSRLICITIIIGSKFHLMLAQRQCTFSHFILFSVLLFVVSYSFSREFLIIIILLLNFSSLLLTLLS